MNRLFSQKFADYLEKQSIIKNDEKNIYSYGISQTAFILLNLFITCLIAFLLDKKVELLIFILEFATLRSFSGGYHSKNPAICTFISSIVQIIAVCSLDVIYLNKGILIAFTIIISLLIAFISPIEANNKPLDDLEKKVYKHRTIVILIALNMVSILGCFLEKTVIVKITFVVILMVLVLQLFCKPNRK